MKLKKLLAGITAAVMTLSLATIMPVSAEDAVTAETENITTGEEVPVEAGSLTYNLSDLFSGSFDMELKADKTIDGGEDVKYFKKIIDIGLDENFETFADFKKVYSTIKGDLPKYICDSEGFGAGTFSCNFFVNCIYKDEPISLQIGDVFPLFDGSSYSISVSVKDPGFPEGAEFEGLYCNVICTQKSSDNPHVAALPVGSKLTVNDPDNIKYAPYFLPDLYMNPNGFCLNLIEGGDGESDSCKFFAKRDEVEFISKYSFIEYGKTTYGEILEKFDQIGVQLPAYKFNSGNFAAEDFTFNFFVNYTSDGKFYSVSIGDTVPLFSGKEYYCDLNDTDIPTDAVVTDIMCNAAIMAKTSVVYPEIAKLPLGSLLWVNVDTSNRSNYTINLPEGNYALTYSPNSRTYTTDDGEKITSGTVGYEERVDLPGIINGMTTFSELKTLYKGIELKTEQYLTDTLGLGSDNFAVGLRIIVNGKDIYDNDDYARIRSLKTKGYYYYDLDDEALNKQVANSDVIDNISYMIVSLADSSNNEALAAMKEGDTVTLALGYGDDISPAVPSAPAASPHSVGMPAVVIGNNSADTAAAGTSESEKKTVSLKESTSVSKDTLADIAGKDVDVEFELSNGVTWEVNGLDVKDAQKVDLGVTLKTKKASAKQLETIAKDKDTFQFSIRHNGDFGFKAVVNIPINKKYNGQFANLYWFHDGKFDFVGSSKVEDGIADFTMTHASDYVIVFDEEAYGEDVSSGAGVYEESETSAAPAAIVVTFAALAVSAVILKKKVF